MVINHRIEESIYAIQKDYSKLLGKSWVRSLSDSLLTTDYMDNLQCYIAEAYNASNFIYPRYNDDIFRPFKLTDSNEPAASPYSNGLAFGSYKNNSVGHRNALKCSLNIKACLDPDNERDFGSFDSTLLSWAQQKVLLLNISLISEYGNVMRHELAFRNFIREVIKEVSNSNVEVVFVFTSAKQAEHFEKYIDLDFHTILHYDGIDPDSSMFEDINEVLRQNRGQSNVIEW
jgi:uracil DNA glycosylase